MPITFTEDDFAEAKDSDPLKFTEADLTVEHEGKRLTIMERKN